MNIRAPKDFWSGIMFLRLCCDRAPGGAALFAGDARTHGAGLFSDDCLALCWAALG